MGGASTVLMASARLASNVKAVAVDSPFSSFDATFRQWLSHKMGFLCASIIWRYLRCWISALVRCSSTFTLANTDVAVAVQCSQAHIFHSHGTADRIVPFENAGTLSTAAQER